MNTLTKTLTLAALALALPVITSESRAAIPIKTERALQAAAPEHLQLEVLKVDKKRRGGYFKVTATAKVLKVERSASAVKAGTEITMVYTTVAVPMPSAPPGLVGKGERLSAYLKKTDAGTFDAAAASGTFVRLPEEKPAASAPGGK